MDCLCGQNISDDHPAEQILHDLESTAYYVGENSLSYIRKLARGIIHVILRWAEMHCCRLKVGAPYVLCFHLSDKLPRVRLPMFPTLI